MAERTDTITEASAAEVAQAAEQKQEQSLTPDIPEPNALPERTKADFAHIPHCGTRQMALKEYQRTLQEFRHTGAVQKKAWKDFAHFVHPRDLADEMLAAHRIAVWEIEQWQEEQEEEREEQEEQEDEAKRESSVFRDALQDARNRLEALKNRAALAEQAWPAPPLPEPPKPVALLRGVAFDPDVPGRDARYEPAIPQLDLALRPEALSASDDETEALLNAIIGECHFYMREVAFPSMCHARVADDRLHWLGKAMQLAETGARVAKAVARLRHGPTVRESHQKITVENKLAVLQGGGGCANP